MMDENRPHVLVTVEDHRDEELLAEAYEFDNLDDLAKYVTRHRIDPWTAVVVQGNLVSTHFWMDASTCAIKAERDVMNEESKARIQKDADELRRRSLAITLGWAREVTAEELETEEWERLRLCFETWTVLGIPTVSLEGN